MIEDINNDHFFTSAKTPLRSDAFELSDDEKVAKITEDVKNILHTLGMDLTDDSLKDTPKRVAKMFVKEIFGGLNPDKKPSSSTFQNNYKYGEMLVKKTSFYIPHASIICCLLWAELMLPIFQRELWLGYQK